MIHDLAKERRKRGIDRFKSVISNVKEAFDAALDDVAASLESIEVSEATTALELLDFKTAAKRLGISEPTVYAMVRNGRIPVVEIPGTGDERPIRRIDARELERCVASWSVQ